METLKIGLLLLLFLASCQVSAQENEKKNKSNWDLGMEGMLATSVGENFYAFNVGGPALQLRLTKDVKIGFGALPSLYIRNEKLGAKLGVAPRVDLKNFVIIAPFYHFDTTETWVWSIGFGYKFHKKN